MFIWLEDMVHVKGVGGGGSGEMEILIINALKKQIKYFLKSQTIKC